MRIGPAVAVFGAVVSLGVVGGLYVFTGLDDPRPDPVVVVPIPGPSWTVDPSWPPPTRTRYGNSLPPAGP